jgi:hypothetical protein
MVSLRPVEQRAFLRLASALRSERGGFLPTDVSSECGEQFTRAVKDMAMLSKWQREYWQHQHTFSLLAEF